jgi:YVTN family beta-propeller protein
MRKSVLILGSMVMAASAAAVGCGGASNVKEVRAGGTVAGCLRVRPGVGARSKQVTHQSSTVAVVQDGKKSIAYVADADDGSVHTVDVATGEEIATTSVAGSPSQLIVMADGRVVVALRDRNLVQVLEPTAKSDESLESRCVIPTAAEPVALATTPDDATLLVSSGWGATLGAYDAQSLARRYEVSLPREPRAVVVSDDGKRAFVTHVVGSRMSVVDLDKHSAVSMNVGGTEESEFGRRNKIFGGRNIVERRACQGYALAKSTDIGGRIFAPQVLVDPGRTDERSDGYGESGASAPELAAVAVIDEDTAEPMAESLSVEKDLRSMSGARKPRPACLLPRAAVVDGASRGLFVACMGLDTIIEYDAASADPEHAERRRIPVAAGPTGLAVDTEGRRLVVFSQFDRTLHVVPLENKSEEMTDSQSAGLRVALSRKAKAASGPDFELGRRLFHSTNDSRISRDGRACASCHPDGRDDALTWATPDGPRQTPMLAGRIAQTAPYGWMGSTDSVESHLAQTFARLGGAGLERRELDALIAFATTLEVPAMVDPSTDKVLVDRGREVFHSAASGCATCHNEAGTFTDRQSYDVKSRADADATATFDTPSLKFVGGTAPYFHDGRYSTLRALLLDVDGKMGHTKHLAQQDVSALEAYLRSL